MPATGIALADLRGEQVVEFGGKPATLEQAKELVKKKTPKFRELLDDDVAKAA